MNDKDKEAFEKWIKTSWAEIDPKDYPNLLSRDAWQAACEYKQKEVDELKDQIDHQDSLIFELDQNVQVFMEKSKALQAENADLRIELEQWKAAAMAESEVNEELEKKYPKGGA